MAQKKKKKEIAAPAFTSIWKDMKICTSPKSWTHPEHYLKPNSQVTTSPQGPNPFGYVAICDSAWWKVPHKYKHPLFPAHSLHPDSVSMGSWVLQQGSSSQAHSG